MSYKDLEVWRIAQDVTLDVHMMSLSLPKFEQYEEAQQIKRSSKSIRSNLVEGYGRRKTSIIVKLHINSIMAFYLE